MEQSDKNKIADEVEFILKAITVIARLVMHINPKSAEDYVHLQTSGLGEAVYDQWIRVVPSDGSQSWYVKLTRQGGGIYRRGLPSDVKPKTVVEVPYEVRSEQEQPLLFDLQKLNSRLDALKSHVSEDDATLLSVIDKLEEITRSVATCYDPLYFTQLWLTYAENFTKSITHQGAEGAQSFLAAVVRQTAEQYVNLKVTGDLLAAVLSFWEICNFIEAYSRGSVEGINFVRYASFLFPPPLDEHPLVKVFEIVEKGAREEFLAVILDAAESLAKQGDAFIDDALQSDDVTHFYVALCKAAPFFLASHHIYHSLLESTDNATSEIRQDAQQLKSLEKVRNVCEEKSVDISGSLWNAVADLDGSQLEKCISEVQQVRAEGGDLAAELKATEFINLRLFYPNSFRKILLQA